MTKKKKTSRIDWEILKYVFNLNFFENFFFEHTEDVTNSYSFNIGVVLDRKRGKFSSHLPFAMDDS